LRGAADSLALRVRYHDDAVHTKRLPGSPLASDAGFTYTGIKLSNEAENSLEKRKQHRNIAYASMGVAIAGSGMMLIWRD